MSPKVRRMSAYIRVKYTGNMSKCTVYLHMYESKKSKIQMQMQMQAH